MLEKIKNFKWGYVLIFLILAAVGVLCIVFPETLKIVSIVSGVMIAIYGIVLFVLTLSKKERGAGFVFRVIIAIMATLAGTVTAIFNQQAIAILTSLLGLYLVIDGSFKLQTTVMSKRYKVASWWIMLTFAVIIILGGFGSLKIVPTEANAKLTAWLLGITLIFDGIANLFSAFYIAAYEKRMKNEITAEALTVQTVDSTSDGDTEDENKLTGDVVPGLEESTSEDVAIPDAEGEKEPILIVVDGEEEVAPIINENDE